jgi:hypothetical protein
MKKVSNSWIIFALIGLLGCGQKGQPVAQVNQVAQNTIVNNASVQVSVVYKKDQKNLDSLYKRLGGGYLIYGILLYKDMQIASFQLQDCQGPPCKTLQKEIIKRPSSFFAGQHTEVTRVLGKDNFVKTKDGFSFSQKFGLDENPVLEMRVLTLGKQFKADKNVFDYSGGRLPLTSETGKVRFCLSTRKDGRIETVTHTGIDAKGCE